VFKALQTYSNGEVVSWIQEATEGAEEPEHPAPVLKLITPAAVPTGAGNGQAAPAAAPIDVASQAEVDSAMRVAIIGVGTGVVGLVIAGLAVAMAIAARKRGGTVGTP
jgi:hypothetical protein